jgi:hypothetical protein
MPLATFRQDFSRATHELVLLTTDVGNVHVVGGGAEIFKLLVGEDVDGNQMNLGVTVLSGLGGGHFDDLARAVLDDNETALPQSRALHGVGGRGTGIGALEGVLMLQTVQSVYGLTKRRKMLRSPGASDGPRRGGVKSTCGAGGSKTYLRVVRHGDK